VQILSALFRSDADEPAKPVACDRSNVIRENPVGRNPGSSFERKQPRKWRVVHLVRDAGIG